MSFRKDCRSPVAPGSVRAFAFSHRSDRALGAASRKRVDSLADGGGQDYCRRITTGHTAGSRKEIGLDPTTRSQTMRRTATLRTTRPVPTVTTRVVRDSRWIHSNQLELGMYVAELDRPWSETAFMFQGFPVESVETLEAVQAAAEYVLVESEKVARVSSNSPYRFVGEHRSRH